MAEAGEVEVRDAAGWEGLAFGFEVELKETFYVMRLPVEPAKPG